MTYGKVANELNERKSEGIDGSRSVGVGSFDLLHQLNQSHQIHRLSLLLPSKLYF